MEYREFPPPPAAAPYVRCLWTLRDLPTSAGAASPDADAGEEGHGDAALPDGSPELIICIGDRFEYVAPDGSRILQPRAFLVGQITRPFVVQPTGAVDLLAVRFEAHGAALVCDALAPISNTWTPIEALPPSGILELAHALTRESATARRVQLTGAWLERLVRQRRPPDARVSAAVVAIRESHGAVNLEALAESLAVSSRTLQRVFAKQVGISPKLLARIVRFQRVLRAWRANPRTFAHVAAESGYFDQSHLVRDFHEFAGAPPAGLLAALPAFTAQFLA